MSIASANPGAGRVPKADTSGKLVHGWFYASTTPGANQIPIADTEGHLDPGWISGTVTPTSNAIPQADAEGHLDPDWLARGDLAGTENQITVTGGTGAVIGDGATLALPQDIGTASEPQFAGVWTGQVNALPEGDGFLSLCGSFGIPVVVLDGGSVNMSLGTTLAGSGGSRVLVIEGGAMPGGADAVQIWAEEIGAGNVALHVMSQAGDLVRLYTQPNLAFAETAHALTAPGDSPASADALRDDLVTNVIPSIEGALDALGEAINDILAQLQNAGFSASA